MIQRLFGRCVFGLVVAGAVSCGDDSGLMGGGGSAAGGSPEGGGFAPSGGGGLGGAGGDGGSPAADSSLWVGVPTASSLYETDMNLEDALYSVTYEIPPGVSGGHTALYIYKSGGPGYAAGNGGSYAITLHRQDVNGDPDGAALASASWDLAGAENEVRKAVQWDTPPVVEPGERYVAVWDKTDGTGAANWVSLDFNAVAPSEKGGTGNPSEPMPWQGNIPEWGHKVAFDGVDWAFREEAIFEPIMEVEVAGVRYGRHGVDATGAQTGPAPGGGWYEVWLHPLRNPKPVSASSWVRQTEIPLIAGRIDELVSSLRYESGSGEVVLELMQGDTVVAEKSVAVSAATFASGPPQRTLGGLLDAPVSIAAGPYALRLRTSKDLVLVTGGFADGNAAGYGYSTEACGTGWMQTSADAGTTWVDYDRYGDGSSPAPDADLPFGIHYQQSGG
jgi:hypothetical protein